MTEHNRDLRQFELMFLHVKQEITAVAHRIEVAPPEQTFQRRILLRRVDILSKIANRTRGGWQLLLPDDFTRDIDAGACSLAVKTSFNNPPGRTNGNRPRRPACGSRIAIKTPTQ